MNEKSLFHVEIYKQRCNSHCFEEFAQSKRQKTEEKVQKDNSQFHPNIIVPQYLYGMKCRLISLTKIKSGEKWHSPEAVSNKFL